MTSHDLPNYRSPPVVEVVIGTQYKPLEGFSAAHIGLYWSTIKNKFPNLDEQPPLPHLVHNQPIRVELSDRPEIPRCWFIADSNNQLLQLQRDRFILNWRKINIDDEYPRYPKIRDDFFTYWKGFVDFLTGNSISLPNLDLLELTYVNLIPQGQGWENMGDVGKVFLPINWPKHTKLLPVPKTVRTTLVFMLPKHAGQLRVELNPVFPENEPQKLRLSLTVTGHPTDLESTSAIFDWFDMAREWIVCGFADLVGPITDNLWGKQA